MSDRFTEIERKFLVEGDFKSSATEAVHIVQGYLNSDPERTVRVRIRNDQGFLTVKGLSRGASRFEWEIPVSADEARKLLALAENGIIDKTRYLVPGPDSHVWEVDEFHGGNEGLVLAEIELSSEDERFELPEWVKKEVTGNPDYFNSVISKKNQG